MKELIKIYQDKFNWFNERLSENTNNGDISDIRREERLVISKSLLGDFIADLEELNKEHNAKKWNVMIDQKKELAKRRKDTRYDAIEIIQNTLNCLDVDMTIHDFAELCVKKIHNLREK